MRSFLMTSLLGVGLVAVGGGVPAAAQEASSGDASLQQQLQTLKQQAGKRMPPEVLKAFKDGVDKVRATGIEKNAKRAGDAAPDFELTNAAGEKVRLSEQLKKGPVVLQWYRGGWCPYCNLQLRAMQKALPEFEEQGATLIAISPQLPDKSLSTKEKQELQFDVVSDLGNKVAEDYGIVFKLPEDVATIYDKFVKLQEQNGDDSNELPLPATYVIGQDGKIHHAYLNADYSARAEPADVVDAVKELKKGSSK
ncbi:Putative peroxiredoxin bcp [Planctomycetes bacterium Pan216]|uniref:thioredoxin-dependent peroxiredoxin n=1 Tax=Kolteria novifilia TaxID=2527975 RepID=A0A518B892_9BACT|nr:Putative peroxiredoxin bcp [Planctomycetes bacterium Pan216]